jgi:hypothetical protein
MRIGLLAAYRLGEEITIGGQSSDGKEFTGTGTLLDVEHSFEDDLEYVLADYIDPRGVSDMEDVPNEDPGVEAVEGSEDEDLEDDDSEEEDDDEYVRSERLTEVSLRLAGSTEITIDLPSHHEVMVESGEDDEDELDDDPDH